MMDSTCLEPMRALAECIHEAVCLIDAEGRVAIWNHSAEKIYNIPREKILRRRITEFFPNALLEEVRKTRKPMENISHMPNDESHILINAMPLYLDGEFKGVVSTDRDYAEVMRLYEDLATVREQVDYLEGEIKKTSVSFSSIISHDTQFMKRVATATQIATTHANVMITGESGTGKEVFARGIHELSGRDGLFVPINCSAIPSELFESEFFGYAPGAFTGASRKGKPGYFELANKGTIFLDEVGEIPLSAQAKLLRVLQEREVVRVGGSAHIQLDVRIVAATNRNLKELMAQDKFREDLYYRLNVVEISLPPLRERSRDVPLLVNHFMKAFASKNDKEVTAVSVDVMKILEAYHWPGNIRELMNVLENMVVTCTLPTIGRENIPEYLLGGFDADPIMPASTLPLDLVAATREVEVERIKRALELCNNNKSKAAALLNVPRSSLYNKLAEYGLTGNERHKGQHAK